MDQKIEFSSKIYPENTYVHVFQVEFRAEFDFLIHFVAFIYVFQLF